MAGFITRFMDERGVVDWPASLTVPDVQGATRSDRRPWRRCSVEGHRRAAPKVQTRVTEMLEIISRVRNWAGGEAQAMAWYRSQPIPALDGRTPEALVKAGQASAVREYLDHVALGGFA